MSGLEAYSDIGSREFKLPLVSIIITAHNYGRFLNATIASVLAQSYRDIECIVVDDGSSDQTPQVLDQATAGSDLVTAIRNPTPLGQGGASRVGFEASRGQFIVFMDGDDVLEADFVRDHVFVNLSSRTPVGCTSSDIYQVVDNRLVGTTGEALNHGLRAIGQDRPQAFRPLSSHPQGPWIYDGPDAEILSGARYVPPGQPMWCWSPMTANMFRRDVLTLLVGFPEFERLRLSTDVYLCTGASLLCGSLLIDKPLSYYRIHGANAGTYQAQLTNVRCMRAESEMSVVAKEMLIEHFTRNAPAVCAGLWSPQPLLDALAALESDLGASGAGSALNERLDRHRDAMIAAVGEARFSAWEAPRRRAPVLEAIESTPMKTWRILPWK
jgi:hypothetical protein